MNEEIKLVGWKKICTRCKREYEEIGPITPPRIYCDCGGAAFATYPIYQKDSEQTVGETPTVRKGVQGGDHEAHVAAGRKGGAKTASNPQNLINAGRLGGAACVAKYGREHMAALGRKGGKVSSRAKDNELS